MRFVRRAVADWAVSMAGASWRYSATVLPSKMHSNYWQFKLLLFYHNIFRNLILFQFLGIINSWMKYQIYHFLFFLIHVCSGEGPLNIRSRPTGGSRPIVWEILLQKVLERFYWSNVKTDVEEWYKSCDTCCTRKGPIRRGFTPSQRLFSREHRLLDSYSSVRMYLLRLRTPSKIYLG
jgi:hypothetical protein